MIREVFIDNKKVDIRPENEAGYLFESPIFCDITKIVSNRTTTYKLPKTSDNLALFGLSHDPQIVASFPYKFHSFQEHRGGLLFINGSCILLEANEQDLEIGARWGTVVNVADLKDLKLRELRSSNNDEYVEWGGSWAKFLKEGDTNTFGFIKVDYGGGMTDWRYMRPAITIQGVLDIIQRGAGVTISYPDRFNEIFKRVWIPLLSTNANEITWSSTGNRINANIERTQMYGGLQYLFLKSMFDAKGVLQYGLIDRTGDVPLSSNIKISIADHNPPIEGLNMELYVSHTKIYVTGPNGTSIDDMEIIEEVEAQTATKAEDGFYHFDMKTHISGDNEYFLAYAIRWVDESGEAVSSSFGDLEFKNDTIQITREVKEVAFGQKLPIIPNLPDLSVLEFIKAVMQMYGLFAYYKSGSSVIELIAIDDIYDRASSAYDWTDKIIPTKGNKMKVTYQFGNNAQKNYFRYKEDSSVFVKADGYLSVDDELLNSEKDLITIPFAPSANKTDDKGTFAYMKLYNGGNLNQIADRVLMQEEGKYYKENEVNYITAQFSRNLHFDGKKGLLNTHYQAYQRIIKRPVIVEFNVYLSEAELYLYKEITPIRVDGIYYMMISIVATNAPNGQSLCQCKAIKMPAMR